MLQQQHDDFFRRLTQAQPTLSATMGKLASYVSENYVQAAFMTTRELAAAAGVSLATVVRFPTALDYPGFPALRASLQDRVNFDLSGVDRLRGLPANNRSPSALLRRIIDSDIESLNGLAHTFSELQLERFVSGLLASHQVIILGFRYVSPLTTYFGYSLAKIKPNVQAYTQSDSSLYDRIRLMTEADTLVVVAFARYPADLVELTRYAHSRGVRILVITDNPLSPVLPMAEVALFARVGMLDFVGSLAAPAALINCVVSELGVRLGEEALERLQAVEDVAGQVGIYIRGGSRSNPLLAWETTNPPQGSAASGVDLANQTRPGPTRQARGGKQR